MELHFAILILELSPYKTRVSHAHEQKLIFQSSLTTAMPISWKKYIFCMFYITAVCLFLMKKSCMRSCSLACSRKGTCTSPCGDIVNHMAMSPESLHPLFSAFILWWQYTSTSAVYENLYGKTGTHNNPVDLMVILNEWCAPPHLPGTDVCWMALCG